MNLLFKISLSLLLISVSADELPTSENKCFLGDYCQDTDGYCKLHCVNATDVDLMNFDATTKNITHLDVSSSNITVVKQKHFERCYNITSLKITGSGVEKIEKDAFENLKNLFVAEISHNKLTRIDPSIFQNCHQLQQLYANDNPALIITENEPLIIAPRLNTLVLSRSNIKNLYPATFRNVTGLKYLNLKDNQLTKVSQDYFEPLIKLRHLYLSNNRLSIIDPNIIANIKTMFFIDLNHNHLIMPENEPFLNAPQLQALHIYNCSIKKLYSATFSNLTGLTTLLLSGNEITDLPKDVFKPLNHLTWSDISTITVK